VSRMLAPKKISKELEEQIQNLASDIYIQVEDKIISLLTNYHQKENLSTQEIEQHSLYQSLQHKLQNANKELDQAKQGDQQNNELIKNSIQKQQQIDALKHQLREISTELAQEKIEHKRGLAAKEQLENSLKTQISAIQAEHNALMEKITILDEQASAQRNVIAEIATHQQQNEQIELLKQQNNQIEQAMNDLKSSHAQQVLLATKEFEQLKLVHEEAMKKLLAEQQNSVEMSEKKWADQLIQLQQRLVSARDQLRKDGDNARDTIKYLRDENIDLNAKLEQQVSALEGKLTEYRLRFEYAQKQLSKE